MSDGRLLGYAEFGDPQGAPVVFLQALPQAELVEYPDEGHMVYITHWAEILRRLGAS